MITGGRLTGETVTVIRLALVSVFLVMPVTRCISRHRRSPDGRTMIYLAGYLTWLVIYAVHSEELKVMFAVPYALVVHQAERISSGRAS